MLPSILALFAFLFVVVNGFDCPPGSSAIPNENECMYPVKQSQFYQDATWQCQNLGGLVTKVTNAFENSYFFSMASVYFTQDEQWLGVQRMADGKWLYQDHTALTYQNWANGEPKNMTGYNCAKLTAEGLQWMAADCSQARPFFCVLPPLAPPPPSKCPSDWVYFNTTNKCYYYYTYNGYTYSFDQAENWCRGKASGAHLVSLHSSEEDNFVYGMVDWLEASCSDPAYVWLGLDNGNGKLGSGAWTDGTPVDYAVGDLGGTGYLGMPKAEGNSGECFGHRYDWYSTWLTHNFGRFVCKKNPDN